MTLQHHLQHLLGTLDLDKAMAAAFENDSIMMSGDVMKITEYAWLMVMDTKFTSSRPNNPALSELTRGAPIDDVLQNLLISEWWRSDAKDIPVRGEIEIQIERPAEYYPPKGLSAAVSLDGEREGSFEETVRRVQRRFEVNGCDFHQVISAINMGPRLIFTKPKGAPESQPFVEPNVKE